MLDLFFKRAPPCRQRTRVNPLKIGKHIVRQRFDCILKILDSRTAGAQCGHLISDQMVKLIAVTG